MEIVSPLFRGWVAGISMRRVSGPLALLTLGLAVALTGRATGAPQGRGMHLATGASVESQAPRSARVGRITPDQAPRLDGMLDDACWRNAPLLGELTQIEPAIRETPDQHTEVRLLCTRRVLYMALRCDDTAPGTIRATQRARDARLDPDDRVEWFFDPFNSRRNGVWFQIGAAGSRGDALIGTRFEKSWDTIWDGRARVTSTGWQAEVAIPFRSLAFNPEATTWGFNLRRLRRSTNSEYRWTNIRQGGGLFFRVPDAGELTGLTDLDQGIGLDVSPFVLGRVQRTRLDDNGASIDDPQWRDDPDAGIDVFYRLTPSLQVGVTVLTDFAETENDNRQINLGRFPLFFPEKRDFFLRGASRFSFGPNDRSLLGFFSRRIGLDGSGGQIPLLVGTKMTGEQDGWEVGLLSTYMGTNETVDSERTLSVARIKRRLGPETTVGAIGTFGRPTQDGQSGTFGVDFYHREPDFIGDQELQLWVYGLGTQSSEAGGDDFAYGVNAQTIGREWSFDARARVIEEEFQPDLGFVRRPGVQEYRLRSTYRPRPTDSWIRSFRFELDPRTVLDTSGEVQDFDIDVIPFGFESQEGDSLVVEFNRSYERVPDDFTILGDIVIPGAEYWTSRASIDFETSEGRPVVADVNFSTGDFYFGTSDRIRGSLTWRPSALLSLSGSYNETRGRLPGPGRNFVTRIGEAQVDFDFTPEVSLRNLIQYDNQSENLGVQSRLRWIVRPGSDLFVVVSGDWQRDDNGTLLPNNQSSAVKLVYTFTF